MSKAQHMAIRLAQASTPAECTRKELERGPALAQHPAEAPRVGDPAGAGPVHRDVAMALEQAHQALDLLQEDLLLRAGQQGHEPALVHRVASGPHLVDGALQRGQEPLRIGVDGTQSTAAFVDKVLSRFGYGVLALAVLILAGRFLWKRHLERKERKADTRRG